MYQVRRDQDPASASINLHSKFEFKRFPVSVRYTSICKSSIDSRLETLCDLWAPRKRQREIIQGVKISQISAYFFAAFAGDERGIFLRQPVCDLQAFRDGCFQLSWVEQHGDLDCMISRACWVTGSI